MYAFSRIYKYTYIIQLTSPCVYTYMRKYFLQTLITPTVLPSVYNHMLLCRALPIDTVKTVVESGRYGRLSPLQVAQRLVRDEGPGHLFRAWPAAMGRGVPSAAVTLMVYDYVADYLVSCRR